MRPDTAVPPFLDLKAWRDGIPDRRLEDKTMICVTFWQPKVLLENVKNAIGKP